jgi:RNA polymerase sigma factor for flagellar operon FliA
MTAAHAAYQAAAPLLPMEPQSRDEIILAELPQVYFIAARIQERLPANVQIEDLVNAGVIGLIEAYNSFDHTRKAQFRTFARFRIRGAILDSLRLLDWGSRSLRRKARDIADTRQRLENSLGCRPTNEEVAAEMHISLEQMDMALTQLDSLQIVNQQAASSFDGEELYDLIESAPSLQESAFDLFARKERKAQLARAIGELNEREQLVLSLYYREDLTMKQVAEVIGIALSRVSQIHTAAIGKLKSSLAHLQSNPRPTLPGGAQ